MKNNIDHKVLQCLIITVLSVAFAVASDSESEFVEDFTEMSLEELVEVEITSASRHKQVLSDSALPVSVVSADDIHYSGLTNLYEILQFTASIDSLQMNRNHYALGVRGLHETFSDRTLTMVNGRSADNPVYGGSEFLRLPLFLEDIKQVEVLRGPSSSAWGANAYNGAINIITKKPEECEGLLFSTTFNHFGDSYNHLRWAESKGLWSWRISAGYESQQSSTDALNGREFSSIFGNFKSRDFRRKPTVDTEFFKKVSEQEKFSFGFGYANMTNGDFGYLTYYPKEDGFAKTARAFTKIERQYDEETKSEIQWSGAYTSTKIPALMMYDALENQFQVKLDFRGSEQHNSTIGADLRVDYVNQEDMGNQDLVLGPEPKMTQTAGAFLVDRWQANERLKIESQLRAGWYSETQVDWAGRLSGIYALNNCKADVLRLSGARSYRTPFASLREVSGSRFGGGYNVIPGDELDNEETYSLEAGYTKKINSKATFRLDYFLQKYDDLIGYEKISELPLLYQPKNLGKAENYGAETELTIRNERSYLSLWYNYSYFQTLEKPGSFSGSQEVRAYFPAKHKIGSKLRFFLQKDLIANINYKHSSYTNGTHGPVGRNVVGFNRLDISLAKKFEINNAKGELLLGVGDLLNETEEVVTDSAVVFYSYETPGRTYFARLQLSF